MDVTDPDVYEELHQYVDLANLADYSLLHFYADAEDWPHHNGYAAVNPVSGDGRCPFFCVGSGNRLGQVHMEPVQQK